MKIKLGISNRHIHLNEEDYELLFGKEEMKVKNKLSQTGQYASNLTVDIKTEKNIIKNVRVIGPIRTYTQLEISRTDSYTLGIKSPVRASGNLSGASRVTIIGPNRTISRNCGIIAERHIHLSPEDVEKRNLQNVKEVSVFFNSEKQTLFLNVKLKVEDKGVWELHLDTDEANAAMLKEQDIGEVLIIK